MTRNLHNVFEEYLEPLGFKLKEMENNEFKISHDCLAWTILLLEEEDGNNYYPLFYFRTHFGVGERTDIHEILPLLVTLFWRINGLGSFRFLGEHNEFSAIDDELYANYIFPSQPLSEKIRLDTKSDVGFFLELVYGILFIYKYLHSILGIEAEKDEEFYFESDLLLEWKRKITAAWGHEVDCLCYERVNPSWYYFRSYNQGVSVVNSKPIVEFLRHIYEVYADNHKCIDGVNAKLFLTDKIMNATSYHTLDLSKKILRKLEECDDPIIMPNENITHVIGYANIISLTNDGSLSEFLKEKEKIKKRNAKENSILFRDRVIEWKIQSIKDCETFENLILEILTREPYIQSAKKVSSTNQGDNGRDIICRYNANYGELWVNSSDTSLKTGKLIVQCKTKLKNSKKNSIGKYDVDVADTIYEYKPDAYLLVTNSQITRDLTEYLEKIEARDELHWLDWWNSFDVEERLRVNPDIMNKYSEIVEFIK